VTIDSDRGSAIIRRTCASSVAAFFKFPAIAASSNSSSGILLQIKKERRDRVRDADSICGPGRRIRGTVSIRNINCDSPDRARALFDTAIESAFRLFAPRSVEGQKTLNVRVARRPPVCAARERQRIFLAHANSSAAPAAAEKNAAARGLSPGPVTL